MVSRTTTRIVLTSIAGGASLAEALAIAATGERRARIVGALRAASKELRDEGTPRLYHLGFEPPIVGRILDGALASRASGAALREAAELAIEAMRPAHDGPKLMSIGVLLLGAVSAIVISQILDTFIAPVLGKMDPSLLAPANLRAQAALDLGIAALLAALIALAVRIRDGSGLARWLWRRRPDRGGAILFAAAGAAAGINLTFPDQRGPAAFEADSLAQTLARLGRIARVDRPRVDVGKLFELASFGLLVLAAYSAGSYYLLMSSLPGLIR